MHVPRVYCSRKFYLSPAAPLLVGSDDSQQSFDLFKNAVWTLLPDMCF